MNDAQWIIQVYETSGDAVLKADGEGIRLRFCFCFVFCQTLNCLREDRPWSRVHHTLYFVQRIIY